MKTENRPKRRRLRRRIFYSILFIALLCLVFSALVEGALMQSQYKEQLGENLKSGLRTLQTYCNTHGGYRAAGDFSSDYRITVISPKGDVLYDNMSKNAYEKNHSDRPEFIQAMKGGIGFSERVSETVLRQSMYAAVRLDDGNVLRLSGTRYNLLSVLKRALVPMLAVLAALLLLILFSARKISGRITEPINKINLKNPSDSEVYEELEPLTRRLTAQNRQIAENIRQMEEEHHSQDRMRQEFTANVSHELKTPLTSISGYAELIETGIAKKVDVPRFAGIIHKESQRLITLAGDIIKLSQMDENEVNVVREEIDLWDTCQSVLMHLQHAAEKKQVSLNLKGDHVSIIGVAQIVEEMIFNLCDNAIKYNRDGGDVTVKIRKYTDGIELSVSDTGIGIPEEDLPHIFERFYRVDKSHSKAIGGTGLGLSIVKHGAQYLDAKVSVESHLGEGSTFRILF